MPFVGHDGPLWISVWKVAILYGKALRVPYKLQEVLTMENGPISIEGFHRKFPQEPLWKISMENQPRIKRHFQKAREASDVDS
eukprot:359461-Chlamydomonas_euryale.AAC.7